VAAGGLGGGPAVGHHHLDLAGRRVGADVDLDPVGPAVGGRVVDQVLDRLAQHGRAGLDLGRGAGLDAHAGPAGHSHGPGRGLDRVGHVGHGLGRPPGAVAEHPRGQGVEVADLGQEQVQHGADVAALVAEERDRLAGDPDRGHPPPQLVGEHGHVIRRPCRPTR
jgi:hypothetical protein